MSNKSKSPNPIRANINNVILSADTLGGWTRQVAIDPLTSKAKEVVHIVNGGSSNVATTTVQRIIEGDIIHRVMFLPQDGRLINEVLCAKVEGANLILSPLSMVGEDGKVKYYPIDSILEQFIKEPANGDKLPSNYGWDGRYTETMLRRRTNFICFLAGFDLSPEELHRLVDILINHSSNSVKISWRDALPIPTEDVSLPSPTTGQTDYWFIIKETGETYSVSVADSVVPFSEGGVLRAIHCRIALSDTDLSVWVVRAWDLYSVE